MSYYEYHVARRYVQFEGALGELANYAALVGRKVLLLTACDPVREQVESRVRAGIEKSARACQNPALAADSPRYARYAKMTDRLDEMRRGMTFSFYDIGDTVVSEENIRRVAAYIKENGFDTVAGIGGGKGQDFARALTHYLPELKVILVPTLAATNASISTLSVLYTPDGQRIRQYWRMDNAPELVLVDTELILQNSPRVLSAGMGDIISTYLEALCNLKLSGRTENIPLFSLQGVRLAADILMENAPAALEAVERGRSNQAFETVLSQIMHNCGPLGMICLTGYAHVVDEMFLYFDAAHRVPHGLRVGCASVAMLVFEGAPEEEIRKYLRFCRAAGIPATLGELGLSGIEREAWREAFDHTVGVSGNLASLPFPITPEEMIDSLFRAEETVARLGI